MMKISGGQKEGNVVIGNIYNKYGSKNPLVKRMMAGFEAALDGLVKKAAPKQIHEIGCGEGHWVLKWRQQGLRANGSDFSQVIIEMAQANAKAQGGSPAWFKVRNIYEMEPGMDGAELIVCCEVLEHLKRPEEGLAALKRIAAKHLVLSVPNEPVWRVLNMARGKYWTSFGNTPGHIQHWSNRGFIQLVERYFKIAEVRTPFPWTMLLCQGAGLHG